MKQDAKKLLTQYALQPPKILRLTAMAQADPAAKERCAAEAEHARRLMREIEEKIEQTDGGVLSELLYWKYVCGKTLEEISEILHYSVRHTERLHIKALEKFPR